MQKAMMILTAAALAAASAGVLASAGPAAAQGFFWETEAPRKAKKKKPRTAKPANAQTPASGTPATGTPAETSAIGAAAAAAPPAIGTEANAPPADPASLAEDARAAAREAAEAAKVAKDAAAAAALLEPRVVPTEPRADADPIVAAAFRKLSEPAFTSTSSKDDVSAAKIFYGERAGPGIWIGSDGFHAKGKAVIDEIRAADDWGLEASAFELPQLAAGAAPEALGEAEAKLTLAALKYARFARGGRINPRSLSRIWDQDPPLRNPNEVMSALAEREEAHSYLRALHPQHEQFKRLREALVKARGPQAPAAPVDPALQIKLPKGQSIKPGAEHADIALLRQRLKVPADAGAKETLLDPKLAEALVAFQKEKGLDAKGVLTQATRSVLNSEGEAKKPNPTRDMQRILINMERWRWMPEDMGAFHVWNNAPEFAVRVVKDGQQVYKEKIIVGQPSWPTPIFSADMLYVMFYPSWGMPEGIKRKELLPRIQAGGGGFFGLFGGGSSVIEAYDLRVYYNGRQIDPGSVNWSTANISQYSFIQPPGPKNPLGVVKFRFPNKHDVYMHDTPERELFARGSRALSHGCIRVNNPMRFAEILIEHDRGPGTGTGRGDVTLKKPVPVHITYFTAVADESGNVSTFGDIYGHDSRLSMALGGKSLPYEAPAADDATLASSEPGDGGSAPVSTSRRNKKKQPESVQDLISNVFLN